MSGRYLLDTNIVVALFNGDRDIAKRLESVPEVFLTLITLGELHFGAANSGRPEANSARIDDFAGTCTLVGLDEQTARRYGALKARLRRFGRPIPENDVWIAASALRHDMIVVTHDQHFAHIDGLETEAW